MLLPHPPPWLQGYLVFSRRQDTFRFSSSQQSDMHPSVRLWNTEDSFSIVGQSFVNGFFLFSVGLMLSFFCLHYSHCFFCCLLYLCTSHIWAFLSSSGIHSFIDRNDPSINLSIPATRLTWIRLKPLCKSITCHFQWWTSTRKRPFCGNDAAAVPFR